MSEQNFMVVPHVGNTSLIKGNRNFFSSIKPTFSFQYSSLTFIANKKTYTFNNQEYPLTSEQQAEVAAFIESVNPDPALTAQIVTNLEAKRYLYETDWYVVRFIETGIPVPEDITNARAAARQRIVAV